MAKIGKFLFRFRGVIGAVAFIILFIIARPKPALLISSTIPLSVGFALRLWARGYIGSQATGGKPTHLITTGPYRLIRNPLYWGNFFLVAGVLIASGLPSLVALAAIVLFVVEYLVIIHAEEALLTASFPLEYPAYKQGTGMVVPKTVSLSPGWSQGFSFRNMKGELWTAVTVAAIYLLLVLKIVL